MGWLDRLLGRTKPEARDASFHVSQEPPGWIDSLAGREVASGALVDESTALGVTTVYACIRVLAETAAALPLHLYERQGERSKKKAVEHPLYPLLWQAPNPEMTSFELREVLMHHLAAWGNAFCEIEMDRSGRVRALWPLRPEPQNMRIERVNGELVYTYRLPSPDASGRTEVRLVQDQVLHFRGMGYDGIRGYSPIYLSRQAIGLAMATEEYGSRFFGNGARPGMVLEHPGKLSKEAHERLKESWEQRHQGLDNAHRVAVLEEGLKIEQIGIPPEDAQFLATRRFQVEEICRIYRVPPHMVQDLERATFSNIENLSIGFVTYTMLPWLVRLEQRMDVALLLERERSLFYVKHEVPGLLRGDMVSRYQAYAQGRQNGWLSANDIRELEDMNPVEGGDVYLVPLNMMPATDVGNWGRPEAPAAPPQGESGETEEPEESEEEGERTQAPGGRESRATEASRHRLMLVWRRVLADTAGRIVRREARDVRAAARKWAKDSASGEMQFGLWAEEYYSPAGEFAGYTAGQMRPVMFSYGEQVAEDVRSELGDRSVRALETELEPWVQRYVEAYAARHSTMSREAIRKRIRTAAETNADWLEELSAELDGWEAERPAAVGENESVRLNNGLAHHMYALAGVLRMQLVAFPGACDYCQNLSGRTWPVNQPILKAGVAFQPEGMDAPLTVSNDAYHPPFHKGCGCMVRAA